jgi:tetratricopeptide (TPR) repeat protein
LILGLGLLVIGCIVIFFTENPLSDFSSQKLTSARYRLLEYFPQAGHDALVPTPNAPVSIPVFLDEETSTSADSAPGGTPQATRVARAVTPTATRPAVSGIKTQFIKSSVALTGVRHEFQRWNNCGPTTLEMYLTYYGRNDTQAQVASFTKPNPDDKNVRPDELAAYANRAGLRTLIRVNGTVELAKYLLSNGIPLIAETAFVKEPQGWMGHYRLLIGYDEQGLNTMDSFDGPNTRITFTDFDNDWRAFDRLYFLAFRDDQEALVRAILGSAVDDAAMYSGSLTRARDELIANSKDSFAQFNYGTSLVGLKRYSEAAAAFDRSRVLGLPWRMMWYQFTPYEAYLQAGRYDEVISLANAMLRTSDDLEESHYYKGLALRALRKNDDARHEFETALRYNKNYREAVLALQTTANAP